MSKPSPSIDAWLKEAKQHESAGKIGMYLTHSGVVRETPKTQVRGGDKNAASVTGMTFSFDAEKVDAAVQEARRMDGIYYVRVWLNEGELNVGDDIMAVLVGGDIRPHVVSCMQFLIDTIKTTCVTEDEHY